MCCEPDTTNTEVDFNTETDTVDVHTPKYILRHINLLKILSDTEFLQL